MKQTRSRFFIASSLICFSLVSCSPLRNEAKVIPSLEYARTIGGGSRQDVARAQAMNAPQPIAMQQNAAAVHQVRAPINGEARFRYVAGQGTEATITTADTVTNIAPELQDQGNYQVHHSETPNIRDYNGPLSLGDPGVSASLWQESRGETNLFHDFRAWQPMDLITINITEKAQGKKEADTDIKSESTFQAAIKNFFGYENDVIEHNSDSDGNPKIDLSNLINASAASEFNAEGETSRADTLTAQISAIVVEVLPGGLLRIEGERIISMNNEEQIMVISGLVRTRDINSENQVESVKIANLRVDYFGRGALGDAQYGGWFANLLRLIWPF